MSDNNANWTDEEKKVIARYLVKGAKERISSCGASTVDGVARRACYELKDLGALDAAEEVYAHYNKTWG